MAYVSFRQSRWVMFQSYGDGQNLIRRFGCQTQEASRFGHFCKLLRLLSLPLLLVLEPKRSARETIQFNHERRHSV
jgi:hypothetical protein